MVGTPRYMAPEQIQEAALDGRVDVYALGVCLYEMLSGRVPFAGATAMDTMNAHLSDAVPPLARDDCPPALAQLVMRMLEKAPDARPASLREVEESLRAIAGGDATAPLLQSPRGVTAHSMRSFVYAGILAAIVLVTGGIGAWRAIATARDADAADARAQPTVASIAASVAPAEVIPAAPAPELETPAATASASARSEARPRPAASAAPVARPASASSVAPTAAASSPRAGILHENEF
jgi:serine/threonine-protein kinase